MYTLYGCLLLMLIISLSILAIPFIVKNNIFSLRFLIVASFVSTLSLGLYHFTRDHNALNQWFVSGKHHYQLMEKIDQLGGVNGIIVRIKKKLQNNPNDAQGWVILGKLYLSQQNYIAAREALSKAHELQPQDEQINRLYELSNKN